MVLNLRMLIQITYLCCWLIQSGAKHWTNSHCQSELSNILPDSVAASLRSDGIFNDDFITISAAGCRYRLRSADTADYVLEWLPTNLILYLYLY